VFPGQWMFLLADISLPLDIIDSVDFLEQFRNAMCSFINCHQGV